MPKTKLGFLPPHVSFLFLPVLSLVWAVSAKHAFIFRVVRPSPRVLHLSPDPCPTQHCWQLCSVSYKVWTLLATYSSVTLVHISWTKDSSLTEFWICCLPPWLISLDHSTAGHMGGETSSATQSNHDPITMSISIPSVFWLIAPTILKREMPRFLGLGALNIVLWDIVTCFRC